MSPLDPRRDDYPLLAIVGPTASGKSSLAVALALALGGEVVSCDAVAVYRGLDIGSAKPSAAERSLVPHHGLDLLDPDRPTTAGDYARAGREALAGIKARGRLPIVAGGTGLYLRAMLEGLAPAPPRDEALRDRLRRHELRHGAGALHRLLRRHDPAAAARIHPNDQPKLIRSLETSLGSARLRAETGQQPDAPPATRTGNQTVQWTTGRDPLQGFRTLILGLEPPRPALRDRIDHRAAAMFPAGLLAETAAIRDRFGNDAVALRSLGYAQALAHLRGDLSLDDAIAQTQAGHRQYAKRQLTWFRNQTSAHWLHGFGDDPAVRAKALALAATHRDTTRG